MKPRRCWLLIVWANLEKNGSHDSYAILFAASMEGFCIGVMFCFHFCFHFYIALKFFFSWPMARQSAFSCRSFGSTLVGFFSIFFFDGKRYLTTEFASRKRRSRSLLAKSKVKKKEHEKNKGFLLMTACGNRKTILIDISKNIHVLFDWFSYWQNDSTVALRLSIVILPYAIYLIFKLFPTIFVLGWFVERVIRLRRALTEIIYFTVAESFSVVTDSELATHQLVLKIDSINPVSELITITLIGPERIPLEKCLTTLKEFGTLLLKFQFIWEYLNWSFYIRGGLIFTTFINPNSIQVRPHVLRWQYLLRP